MLVDLLLILTLGGGLSWLSQRLRFPNAVAQVLLGVILGTALLGWVTHSPLLHVLGEIGVILLLGVAGLELSLQRLTAVGGTGFLVALLGIVFSVAGGYGIAMIYGSPSDEALYVGLALCATSIGIVVQLLQQVGLVGHRVADILVAAAVIDDVIALYLLGAAHGVLSDGYSVFDVLSYVLLAVALLSGVFVVCRWFTGWVSGRTLIDGRLSRTAWTLAAIGLGALLTESLGLSSVVGAFFAGVGVGEGLTKDTKARCASDLQPAVLVLMPFFFVMIGVQAQWDIFSQSNLLWLVVSLTTFAILAKAIGGAIGAFGVEAWFDRWLIGFGMIARGEVGLIIASIGYAQGHIAHPMFAALVLTTIVVSVVGPLLMLAMANRLRAQLTSGVGR